jgi:hypothetical protein
MQLRTARPLALAALTGLAPVLACLPFDISTGSAKPPAPKVAVLRGVVMSASGDALESAKVEAGDMSATTNEHGRYELKVTAGKNRVRFALDGYVDSVRSMTLPQAYPTQLDVPLLPRAEPIPLDAAQGGTAAGERGAALSVRESAFVNASGKAVSGMVDVYLSAFDPSSSDDLAAAPELETTVEGDIQMLESFGMVDIQVEQDGKQLGVADAAELELSIPVPDGSQPPATIDLWRYDETGAVWVNDGNAKLDADAQTYVGTVERAALWSAGDVYSATCICGVVDETGQGPLAGARIEANGVSYFGSSSEQTDANGRFCMAVRKDSEVDVAAYHASEGGETKRIHTKSAATLIPPRSTDARCEDVGTWSVTRDGASD